MPKKRDVYLRGSVYWCWIKDYAGRWQRKSTGRKDRAAAIAEKRKLERFYADPDHYAAHTATFNDALNAMIDATRAKGRAAGTIQMHTSHAGHYVRIFGQAAPLSTVTARSVDEYVAKRLAEGASPHTVHKELVTLRKTLKLAKRRKEFTADISEVLPEFSPQYVPRQLFLTPKQLDLLLGKLAKRRAAHVAFVVATGARKGEAARAQRSDVEGQYAALRGTKTARSARTVAIVGQFAALLERALRDGRPKGLLFDSWGNAHRDIHSACERAKVPLVSWNDLRRTFGSWLKQAGVPLDDIADQLGHTSTVMVRRVYGVDTPEALANRIRERLEPKTPRKRSANRTATTQPESDDAAEKPKTRPTDENK